MYNCTVNYTLLSARLNESMQECLIIHIRYTCMMSRKPSPGNPAAASLHAYACTACICMVSCIINISKRLNGNVILPVMVPLQTRLSGCTQHYDPIIVTNLYCLRATVYTCDPLYAVRCQFNYKVSLVTMYRVCTRRLLIYHAGAMHA